MKNKLQELYLTIKKRKEALPDNSYTTKLFVEGENTIVKKLGEELSELIMAVGKKDKENQIYESVDLIYHLFVLLNYQEVDIDEIYEEIESRKK
jgi:phosphoribosyl-ATP pyrophosphohydrolase